ncbi:iron-containing alcohol dehydrogenase [Gottschalkiaceae bacterium SANA]|nr:iron-containing alcohol dehydrogenase [Gottschalkiaceae bacterium SANA]
MDNFRFKSATRILFGKGLESQVGQEIAGKYKKVLIHYGGAHVVESGLLDRVTKSLEANFIDFVVLDGVVPNPRLTKVHAGIELCRKEDVDFILAIGGGSAIDSSKAIAMGVPYGGDVWDFYTGSATPESALPVGTILTIPGSGSEMSESSIITHEEQKLKYGIDNELIVPVFSVLNPEMCLTIPPRLMAAGIADILSHLMERYFTPTKQTILSDFLLEGAMKAVMEAGLKLMAEPKNYDHAAEIMWSATVAHNGMLSSGRIEDWASHRIEHEISALYDVTHGAGMAMVFPSWMRYVKDANIERFCRFASEVFGVAETSDRLGLAESGICALEKFFTDLGLQVRLSQAGVPVDQFALMAQKATQNSEYVGNFKKINAEDIVKILEMAV